MACGRRPLKRIMEMIGRRKRGHTQEHVPNAVILANFGRRL